MSKISLKPNSAGTANFEIAAPATNTDRTFTLPDEAGTVLTNASDIESQVKTATNASGTAPIYACRACVNFTGEGTVSIRDSGNVSSVTDDGTGQYTVNFTTAMPDENYSFLSTSAGVGVNGANPSDMLASSVSMTIYNAGSLSFLDREHISVAIFR